MAEGYLVGVFWVYPTGIPRARRVILRLSFVVYKFLQEQRG